MRNKLLLLVGAVALGACSSVLDVAPTSSVPSETAIVDAAGARAALAGAYAGLQSNGLYGHTIVDWTEVLSDNGRFVGTFDNYADADANALRADNSSVAGIWNASYDEINRANELIQKVPSVPDLSQGEKDEIVGEAYFLRALTYHNMVKLWGGNGTLGVPLRLEPVPSATEVGDVTRVSRAEVYTQILADLAQAKALISDDSQTRQASLGAVSAIEARVRLYMADYAGAEAAAAETEAMGYSLAPSFSDLFDAEGNDTPEDIFRVTFTPTQAGSVSFYYLAKSLGGRREVAPTTGATGIIAAFDPASGGNIANYHPTDERGIWSIALAGPTTYASKFRNPGGDEDIHVIRLGEVILIRAEALARLNRLPEAVIEYNQLRVRAGLAPDLTTGLTQAGVLAAIARERRLELAFEGDRWPDLVRTGTLPASVSATQALLPIPQAELDVSPNIQQNPGY
ncbi:MAG TPA: RagB/SusD family nutrient uptake outer membrane protein [Gemmatimonadaceae bacterium]|nr:RagB/SusD family nutrient uptake outer membrane protein [Gemmatimonadaceae bacterium]